MRMTLVGLILAGGTLGAAPALATDFSKVRCENPAFQKFIATRLPKMHAIQATRSVGDRFTGARVASASTVSASSGEIICAVTLDMGAAGRPVHGRFSIQQMADGRNNWKWLPGY